MIYSGTHTAAQIATVHHSESTFNSG